MLDFDLQLNLEGNDLLISHDGSTGAHYTVENYTEIAQAIEAYIKNYLS